MHNLTHQQTFTYNSVAQSGNTPNAQVSNTLSTPVKTITPGAIHSQANHTGWTQLT
jgi:hypothetical protein